MTQKSTSAMSTPVSSGLTTGPAATTAVENPESSGFLDSEDGILRVSGRGQLRFSLEKLDNPPGAPAGWQITGPVFDILARDNRERAVQQLSDSLDLRFKVATSGPVTVLVYGDNGWDVVTSEVDDEGNLIASVDHLTPYTTGSPTISLSASPSLTRSLSTVRPSLTLTTATASGTAAQTALSGAVQSLKMKNLKITSAAGYNGSLYIALPSALQDCLGSALDIGGEVYYGLYNAVNEVITAGAEGSQASGELNLAVEPRTSLPDSEAAALELLLKLFPGIGVELASTGDSTGGYLFYGSEGSRAGLAGCLDYNGLILCYAVTAGGSYQPLLAELRP